MAINTENLTKLINHLKKVNRKNFDMAEWYDYDSYEIEEKWAEKPAAELVDYMEQGKGDCGTVACIAGHAALLDAAERNLELDDLYDAESLAKMWLGLDAEQAHKLFKPGTEFSSTGWLFSRPVRRHTLPKAITVLENLKETAEKGLPSINWRIPIKKQEDIDAVA